MWRLVGWVGAWLSWLMAHAISLWGWVAQVHSCDPDHQGEASGKDRQQEGHAQARLPQMRPGGCEGREYSGLGLGLMVRPGLAECPQNSSSSSEPMQQVQCHDLSPQSWGGRCGDGRCDGGGPAGHVMKQCCLVTAS